MCVCKRFNKVFKLWIYDRTRVRFDIQREGSGIAYQMAPAGLFWTMLWSSTVRSLVRSVRTLEVFCDERAAGDRAASPIQLKADQLSLEQFRWILFHLSPRTLQCGVPSDQFDPVSIAFTEAWRVLDSKLPADRLQTLQCEINLPASLGPPMGLLARSCNTLTTFHLPPCSLNTYDIPFFPHLTDVREVLLLASSVSNNGDFACAVLKQAPKLRELTIDLDIDAPILRSQIIARQLESLCEIVGTRLYDLEVYHWANERGSPAAATPYSPDYRGFIAVRQFNIEGCLLGWDLGLLPPRLEQLDVDQEEENALALAARLITALTDERWQKELRLLGLDVQEGSISPAQEAELAKLCKGRDLEFELRKI